MRERKTLWLANQGEIPRTSSRTALKVGVKSNDLCARKIPRKGVSNVVKNLMLTGLVKLKRRNF